MPIQTIPQPIFQKAVKKTAWKKIFAREYGVQYSEMALRCLTDRLRDFTPYTYKQIIIPEGQNVAFLVDAIDWANLVESLERKYASSTAYLGRFERGFKKFGLGYLRIAKKIAGPPLRGLSNEELGRLYEEYQRSLLYTSVFTWSTFILNNLVAEKATGILERYIEKSGRQEEKLEIIEAFLRPVKKAAVFRLQEEVGKLKGRLTSQKLDNLYLKYRWLSCLDIHNPPWTKSAFRKHLRSLEPQEKRTRISVKEAIKELGIRPKDRRYLEMARRFAYIKDARDDFRRQGVFHAQVFFKEITRRMGIALKEISYLQENEITAFLQEGKKVPRQIIEERQRGFVLYYDEDKEITCIQGKAVPQVLKDLGVVEQREKTRIVRGAIASRGKVKGRAVVVRGVRDLLKVKEGDIMVAIATHPDYVPAMRLVVGVVTDEGGMTSHAAIVSREFGIPCIVGTRLATTVFKDGDLVEVDAEKGLVRKLEK